MTDLNKLREQFEQLPVIAHGLKHRQFYFDDQDDCYTPTSNSHYHDAVYANGALDAYQEQQAKIDALTAQLDKLESGDYVLVPKDSVSTFWQDADEPENICSSEADFDCLGDCIEIGDIMAINKHTQGHIRTEALYGTWFSDLSAPAEKANFFVGTEAECLKIVSKNKAMLAAAQEQNDD